MGKEKIKFICEACGAEYPRWQGKCDICESWNSLVETKVENIQKQTYPKEELKTDSLFNISLKEFKRVSTGIEEFDEVLGGGIVPGSIILLGGEPGIGKSTLLLQLGENLKINEPKILYIAGEESIYQIKLRAQRIGVFGKSLFLFSETNLEKILNLLNKNKFDLIIVDSIQTLFHPDLSSGPGSIAQIKLVTEKLIQFGKTKKIPVFLIGHVTKEGGIAGPKALEHLVDVVLYLEGERFGDLRVLRSVKNRFGKTAEIGVFRMTEKGLIPSKEKDIFLKNKIEAPGSVVSCIVEGTRPFLIEIQALSSKTIFGYPKRTSTGFDLNRLNLLIAVLKKRGKIDLFDQDVYLNIAGGLKVIEPAIDLAIILALASSFKNKAIDKDLVSFGEVGLLGEVRNVSNLEKRIKEAIKLGFKTVVMPYQNYGLKLKNNQIKLIKVKTIKEAIKICL